jgi:uncharacterized ferritin-like protein (DUF455 family)
MESVFAWAERILCAAEIDAKVGLTFEAAERYRRGQLGLCADALPLPISEARFPERPPWVDPRNLPKRKLTTIGGRVALLHSVAHIEFSAIQLAWDHLYRFRGMPDEYYWDWLSVAEEEARHFQMIRERLDQLGADYGDLPVHGGLWGLACETADDVLARMALVPRFMEARGLDVTPGIMERLDAVGDVASNARLQVILDEEVGHVALGSKWFHWEASRRGVDAEQAYFELLEKHLNGQTRGPFNGPLRLKAGFSESELLRLSSAG